MQHVMHGYMLGDCHDQRDLGLNGFLNGSGGGVGGDEDGRGIRPERAGGLGDQPSHSGVVGVL